MKRQSTNEKLILTCGTRQDTRRSLAVAGMLFSDGPHQLWFCRSSGFRQVSPHQRQERNISETIPVYAESNGERSATAMRTRLAASSQQGQPLIACVARGAASGVVR
jgi:hypothetical protein